MPSMDLAKIDSLTLLSLDSADIVTSVGTPKRYAICLTCKQLYEFERA